SPRLAPRRQCVSATIGIEPPALACVPRPSTAARMSAPPTSRHGAELEPWMARLADGDRSVFPQLFAQLWPPIRRLCLSLLQNEADAADAAQEALQKILERAPADYERSRPALPWALAIAGWECRTLLRKRQRRHEVPEQ